jgi:hypothetical protein
MYSFTFGLIGQSILDKIHLRQVWLMRVFACNCSVCGVTSDNDLQRYSLSTAPFFFLLFFLCESIILIAQHQCCTHLENGQWLLFVGGPNRSLEDLYECDHG